MSEEKKAAIEALLFAAKGLTTEEIARRVGISEEEVENLLQELELEYTSQNRGIHIIKEGEIWKMSVKPELTKHVKDIVPPELPKSITKTLAVIAAHRPVLQSYVVKIRGNKAYDHIKELEKRGFIIAEKKGNSLLLDVTQKFFDYFNIDERKFNELLKRYAPKENT